MSFSAIPTELPNAIQSNSTNYHGKELEDTSGLLGFCSLTALLLVLCALFTGLTLAICGLDITRLQVLCVTGNQRQRDRALVTLRIKRHMSWFLCSMIICSVACAESIPVIIGSLFGNAWLPIVVSTVAIAFFAELLPQFIIPRYAIVWSYYCWPLIWVCMWLTCIISWPLSYLLDAISGPKVDKGIYTAEQLGILITLHERAEKHGGLLGPDASRIMRGALNVDNRTLIRECRPSPGKCKSPVLDIEKGEAAELGILVPWSSVRCISINDEVNKEFVVRVKDWAYSRIPVLGDVEVRDQQSADCCEGWNNQKVYGFLHVKNLIGLDLSDQNLQSKRLLVKDLPLYPLPIVRNDLPLYDLLNIFQLGMARMAVVIPRPTKDRLIPLSASLWNQDTLPRYGAPLWSASTGLNARNAIEMAGLDAHIDWTIDFLDAAQNEIELPQHRKHSFIGIGCPKPIGIVTYEDVIDAILQKTSLDEKDFYERSHVSPPTKRRKEGDTNSVSSNHSILKTKIAVPLYVAKVHAAFERRSEGNNSIVRRRVTSRPKDGQGEEDSDILRRCNIARPEQGINYISEQTGQGFDGANERDSVVHNDAMNECSSYTENSQGGFHDSEIGVKHIDTHETPTLRGVMDSNYVPTISTYPAHVHFNVRRECTAETIPIPGTPSCASTTILPGLRRATSFSKPASQNNWRSEEYMELEPGSLLYRFATEIQDHPPLSALTTKNHSMNEHNVMPGQFHNNSTEAATMWAPKLPGPSHVKASSRSIENLELLRTTSSNVLNLTDMCYDEDLIGTSERASSSKVIQKPRRLQNGEVRMREESFHDDRTLLPSQRELGDRKSRSRGRRISLWF